MTPADEGVLQTVTWDESGDGRIGGVAVRTIVDRLGRGEDSVGVSPKARLTALAAVALGPPGSLGPPLVQARPSLAEAATLCAEPSLRDWLPPGTDRRAILALSAGLLQVFDHWDLSHQAAQEADDLGERSTSAYWHAVAHRREPDGANAAYWFRRVGRHPLLERLARPAAEILEASNAKSRADRVVASDVLNPLAMIDLCLKARSDPSLEALARRLQRLEMAGLLAVSMRDVGLAPAGES